MVALEEVVLLGNRVEVLSLGLMGSWVLESPLEMEARKLRRERIDLCKGIEFGGCLTRDGELRLKCSSSIQIQLNEHSPTLAQIDRAPFLQWLH
jgi:hypothetical protein